MRYIILSSLVLLILSCGSSFGTNYDDKISELEDLVSNLESQVYDNGSRISYLESQIDDNESMISDLESQVYDNGSRISNLEWEVSRAKSMIEDLEFNSY